MISLTSEYALRAVAFLAKEGDRPHTNQEIAEATQVPMRYLAKVMLSLSRAGVVKSQRGPNGGFVLNGPANKVTLLSVINAVDPIRHFPQCPLNLPEHGERLCPLHHRLEETAVMVERVFAKSTAKDLITESLQSKRACRFPVSKVKTAKK